MHVTVSCVMLVVHAFNPLGLEFSTNFFCVDRTVCCLTAVMCVL